MRQENNFDLLSLYGRQAWYTQAADFEFNTTWGSLKQWENAVPHLQFMRCQTAFLDSERDDLIIRRRAALSMAANVLSPEGQITSELQKWSDLVGVESCSNRLADAICTLYDEAPTRVFSEDQGVNEGFDQLYKDFDVNGAMAQAYRYALFTNLVLLWPKWGSKEIDVLTPDYFRVEGTDGKISALWLCFNENTGKETYFERWDANECQTYDAKGKVWTMKCTPNLYKRIPGTFLKLNRSKDLYGSGITEAAEINAWNNVIGLLSTRISVFQSYGIMLALNMDIAQGTNTGPGSWITAANRGGDPSTVPDLRFITQDGKFLDLDKQRRDRVRAFEHNHGLPGFLVDESSGTPPTGIALQVLERPLNKKRKQHIPALLTAEKDLAELLAQLAGSVQRRALAVDPKAFAVNYAKPETFTEPSAEFEFDLKKMERGFTSPSALASKYLGMNGVSDKDAMDVINKNKALFAGTYQEPAPIPEPTKGPFVTD